jgi:hypothetical protein
MEIVTMRRKIFFVILLLALLLVAAAPAAAAQVTGRSDRVIRAGETVREDVLVLGGGLLVEEGATVIGDISILGGTAKVAGHVVGSVFILGGTAELSGAIDADLVIMGGTLDVLTSADVDGECLLIGGAVSGDGAAELGCTSVGGLEDLAIPGIVRPGIVPAPPRVPDAATLPEPARSEVSGVLRFFGRLASAVGQSLLLGLLALVIAAAAPGQLDQVTATMREKPLASGVVGFLTAVAGPSLAILLLLASVILTIVCIGLLGYPIVFVLLALLALGGLLGWVAAGAILGRRLAAWLKVTAASPALMVAMGTAILTFAAASLSALPFYLGGWFWSLAAAAVACGGLGAVALTRFGTRPYPYEPAPDPAKLASVMDRLPAEEQTSGSDPY